MNCPSRTDDSLVHPTWNQSPPHLNSDLTTRQDFNGIVNLREQRESGSNAANMPISGVDEEEDTPPQKPYDAIAKLASDGERAQGSGGCNDSPWKAHLARYSRRMLQVFIKYAKFVGPGFLIAVAYIDPGNYATDVAAGAETKFALLFIVLMSNLFAIFLQSLCIKLGSVTGLNLAENCRAHLPKWLTIILYICAEAAIIATDIAEVVGSAIALNLLLHIPLVAGCAITLVDVLVILIFYRPNGSMTAVRAFELFVMMLVLGVVVCFCIQLSLMPSTAVGEVFRGYVPSAAVVESNGLYLSCGILGATVMPHSIFLGSGIVQSRLKRFDIDEGRVASSIPIGSNEKDERYRPSVAAIRNCLKYSIIELALSLFTFALFVNSSILIVAGSSLFENSEAGEADLFGIHKLLSDTISPVAGTIFALALLLSGISAGIVCTMAGQMVSEGMLNWSVAPWLRRLITRSISIIPSIIIAAAVGKEGLNATLTATQVVLSVILPFVTAPLIYFTCRNRYMTVETGTPADGTAAEGVKMRNHWAVAVLAILIWLVIAVMNVALLVLVGMGKA
ncbi:natural resistance-associated macrophage protein-domain-containing protein [Lipomyces tetrasporus]|uniref:Natural resistance-associated macrophage protein-domain-containing protein n=1 Tax=Lipomyces tetrasporus TaxID=54092 RepID=A0AAD7QUE0_9ASCO|nr:natural resistance-associated macrophage protein-domain-containing protein [Lipomyces tetrasporus]KAJ8101683.1 natural resistance-associated macrophage protein-domain-containing protein [Lipomyces tetrasporus]